jgi:hypothetical protein
LWWCRTGATITIITIIITTITITTDVGPIGLTLRTPGHALGFILRLVLPGLLLRGAMKMPIGAVEYGVGR